MVYEPHFQPCPYRTANNHCVNKKVRGKHCGYKRVELCEKYLEWVKGQKIDSARILNKLGLSIENKKKSKIEPINPPKNTISTGGLNK